MKITPLGSHDGEFRRRDRAMVFEDPDGTRILHDAAMTVAGPDDPRLGKIDAVLLTSVHADHLGIFAIPKVNADGVFTSGPKEAAFSINELIKPKAVIP